MIGTMLEYLKNRHFLRQLLYLSVSIKNFLLREQPVKVDIKTEAGGDVVWDAAPDLEVHLTILRDPPGQANIEILSS